MKPEGGVKYSFRTGIAVGLAAGIWIAVLVVWISRLL